MNDINITANFGRADSLTEKFWARIEVVPPEDDFIALSEAAEVIDAIYAVDPCNEDSALIGGQSAAVIPPEYVSPLLISSFSIINYNPCKYAPGNYDFEAVVYVFRSHINTPYRLVINDGTIISTQTVEKRISTLVKPSGKTIDVDYPIIGGIECDQEIVEFKGARALLRKDYASYLAFAYDTQYDKVTIRVKGTESEPQDAECLVFFMGLVYRETVVQPEEDIKAVSSLGCNPTSINGVPSDDTEAERPETCYQRTAYTSICECSGTTQDTVVVVDEVPCPDSPATTHSHHKSGGINFWDTKHINSYIPCSEDGNWEGTDPEFFLEKCCVPMTPETTPPTCQERTTSWFGGVGIIKGADHYLNNAFRDEHIILVPVAPEDGICGTITYRQEVKSENCCDNPLLTPVVYDVENSVEVIGPNSSGMVFWEGGKAPYEISVKGTGFYLDANHTVTEGTTTGKSARVYTNEACGSGDMEVTDGCSTASSGIRSTEGQWVVIDWGESVASEYKGSPGTVISVDPQADELVEYISGKYRVSQEVGWGISAGGGGWVFPPSTCMSYEQPTPTLCGSSHYDAYLYEWDAPYACLSFATTFMPEGYSRCYENDAQYCSTGSESGCQIVFGSWRCIRGSITRSKRYQLPYLEEWQC